METKEEILEQLDRKVSGYTTSKSGHIIIIHVLGSILYVLLDCREYLEKIYVSISDD